MRDLEGGLMGLMTAITVWVVAIVFLLVGLASDFVIGGIFMFVMIFILGLIPLKMTIYDLSDK